MEMHDLLGRLFRLRTRAVLATVIEAEGHTYRKAGASMLLLEGGGHYGSISPGCLEADLEERTPDLLRTGAAQLVEYDMRPPDDFSWGEAVGCGGVLRVLLEPVHGTLLQELLELKYRLDRGHSVCMQRRFVRSYTEADYALAEPCEETTVDKAAFGIDAGVRRLDCIYVPKPRLVLFGATDDAIPVAELAVRSGFRVVVADWREALCTAVRFPGAARVIGSVERIAERLRFTQRDFVLIMSHHFPHDAELLDLLFPGTFKYVGVMGSLPRTERLLDGREAPSWLRFPVGMDIGAAGPEEIAVSIVAELIEVRRKMCGAGPEPAAERRNGGEAGAGSRYLFGSRRRLKNGRFQTVHPAGRFWKARRFRS